MGDVWRCVDDVLGRTVAVKILLPSLLEEPGFTERFRGEARTMASINHAGVVDIFDYGSDPATGAYLVMEYVEGDALSRTLTRVGRLTPARTMALVAQAADALYAAHQTGVVHRDVKPGNLLVRPNGTLVLTDFGIARSVGAAQLTAAGSVLGTASYISPEQAMGEQATQLSDVYALGVVAYQCLAGRLPFEGESLLQIALRHANDEPPPLPDDVPPAVRAVVARALAKEPAARFASAADLAAAARQAAVPSQRRSFAKALVIAGPLLAVVAATTAVLHGRGDDREERPDPVVATEAAAVQGLGGVPVAAASSRAPAAPTSAAVAANPSRIAAGAPMSLPPMEIVTSVVFAESALICPLRTSAVVAPEHATDA